MTAAAGPRCRAAGFTLVEACVGILLTVLTFSILWGLFYFDNKRISSSMQRLGALRGAELVIEYLRSDLRNLAMPEPKEYLAWGGRPILLACRTGDCRDGFDMLTFYRHVRDTDPASPLCRVTYVGDLARRCVVRDACGERLVLGAGLVTEFSLMLWQQGGGQSLVYQVQTRFLGMEGVAAGAGDNVKAMRFRGQLDLLDPRFGARQHRWVPSAP